MERRGTKRKFEADRAYAVSTDTDSDVELDNLIPSYPFYLDQSLQVDQDDAQGGAEDDLDFQDDHILQDDQNLQDDQALYNDQDLQHDQDLGDDQDLQTVMISEMTILHLMQKM